MKNFLTKALDRDYVCSSDNIAKFVAVWVVIIVGSFWLTITQIGLLLSGYIFLNDLVEGLLRIFFESMLKNLEKKK